MNKISNKAKIFKDVNCKDSIINDYASVGDFSIIKDSSLKEYSRIDRYNYILSSHIDRYSYTGRNTNILKSNIGSFTSISWNVTIGAGDHNYSTCSSHPFINDHDRFMDERIGKDNYERFQDNILIGNDVWIGCGAFIKRGIKIGNGSIVGANSVVTEDIPDYAIVFGAPARHFKYRFSEDIIDLFLQMQWWNWPIEKIIENIKILRKEPDIKILKKIL